jgi:hypothetical protein
MQIHLYCPRCLCHFTAPADTPAAEVLGQMNDDAPWFALAEGKTFEEMVFTALSARGRILCPECRREVLVGGESLARFAGGCPPRRESSVPAPRSAGSGSEPV